MAGTTTPNYEIDYNDERFVNVKKDYQQDMTETQHIYDGMINQTDKFYQDQANALKDWSNTQQQIQQEQTDFAIEKIEQEKKKAETDYVKEQSGAYVDWQKQSNPYGAEAEKMASAGLTDTGFAESSQVAMYNQYQNRVATARQNFDYIVMNYNNMIKDAQLQNSAAMAEIAFQTQQQCLELALQGFQYKNDLLLAKADKITELKNTKWQKEMAILDQMNTENALKENVRQFDERLAFDEAENQKSRDFEAQQAQIDREFKAAESKLDREFEAKQKELDRLHDEKLLKVKNQYEKEQLAIQHKNDMAKLSQQLANQKALLSYEYNLKKQSISSSGGSGSTSKKSSSSKGKTTTKVTANSSNKTKVSSYQSGNITRDTAIAYMKQQGVPSAYASSVKTRHEWSRATSSKDYKNHKTYESYLQSYVNWNVSEFKPVNATDV